LGRTPHRALYHPRDDDVIDCGITSENAGDQIPNHLLRVLNVSSTFIELAFVNVRINDLPFRIYLHPGDFLDLGDDNWFEVIVPDEANDEERDRKGAVADASKEEEDLNNPTSTDLFLALALAMAFFSPCSAILTQSYGKSIRQFWEILA
jgi:hypothetical protein